MSKKLQLTIAEPCHENWDGMTPVEKGKFCGSCQKQVVDFSEMSDRQVAEFFKKPSNGSVCGRFMSDQLDREIAIPRKRIPWVKYFFHIALPAFLMSMKVSAQKTQGKVKVSTTDTVRIPVHNDYRTMGMVARPMDKKPVIKDTVVTPIKKPVLTVKGEIAVNTQTKEPVCSGEIIVGDVDIDFQPAKTDKNEIIGRVVDEKGEPVAFASIETSKPCHGVIADENGFFIIKKSWLKKDMELLVSSSGFESRKIIAGDEKNSAGELYIQLKANVVLPEVVVISYVNYRMGKIMMGAVSRVKKEELILTKKDTAMTLKEIKFPAEENSILVYPNPVRSGAALNLSVKILDEGYYQFQILNQSGQMIQQKKIWIDAEARLLNVDVPSVAAGSYFMVLTNKETGKKFTKKIIVQ